MLHEVKGQIEKGGSPAFHQDLKTIVADPQRLKSCYWRGGNFTHARPI